MKPPRVIRAADLFCGAGGASTGLHRACQALGLPLELLAINHWPIAIETHSLNYPGVKHLCESVERINPRVAIPGGRLHLLIAAPECTNHSRARGGRPVNDQSRATAWHILKWCQELYIDNVLIENVEEFREWGPLGANGKPLKSKKGETYRAFLAALRSLGYTVQDRVLNAADYGDPTTRRRLFIMARRGRGPVSWPTPTHSPTGERHLFGKTARWRPARDVIDWSIPSRSIFNRKKPLSPRTMARILAGLERFGGKDLQPFLVVLRNHADGRSLDRPMPAIAAQGQHVALCEPFILPPLRFDPTRAVSVDAPLPTITATGGRLFGLVEPFILQQQSGGAPRSTDQPLPAIATDGAQALVQPFIVEYHSEKANERPRTRGVDEPLPTATTENRFGLVEPFLVHVTHGRDLTRAHDLDNPLPTVTTAHGGELALVEPFIASYYGTQNVSPVSDPLPTVTTKDRFALVLPMVDGRVLDIHLRMLRPQELAAAMSFDRGYRFAGNQGEQVKQIGNAWACELGKALCVAALKPYASRRSGRWPVEATA